MGIKVIGAGFGRTGTLSLKVALEKLGFDKCYHMMEVHQQPDHRAVWSRAHQGERVDWNALFDGYEASVDWPSCNLWRDQWEHFPNAKIILSLRDAERWYASIMATIFKSTVASLSSEDESVRLSGEWAMEIIWQRVFDGRMDDRSHVISVFNKHNEDVMASVPQDSLLVFEASQGWQPLCEFLDVEVPQMEYPRVNTTDQFNERWNARQ